MKWTDAQSKTIQIRNKNILVSAAAGSGKTAVLVERIKKLLVEDQVPLSSMLIVTFSNAAATEMREKIVNALSLEMESNENGRKDFLREQLSMINQANISTFHAFSMEVIRRYFHIIQAEPNFRICDDTQKSLLQGSALDQLFQDLFEREDPEFFYFLTEYCSSKNETVAKEMILSTHEFIQSMPNPYDWLEEKTEELKLSQEEFLQGSLYGQMRAIILSSLSQALKFFSKTEELLEDTGLEGLVLKCRQDMDSLAGLQEVFEKDFADAEEFGEALSKLSAVKFQQFRAGKAEKADYEEIQDRVTALRNEAKNLLKKISTRFALRPLSEYITEINETYRGARFLSKLVMEFDEFYKKEKQDRGLLDFNDIEHYALKILENENVAKEYRDKFQYIFIDEYQDSNLVQETLIGKIKRDNNLFMVGDVKQSIYKFRLAEPEIFIHKYEDYSKNQSEINTIVDLNENFRSKASIIQCVNSVFSHIMSKETTGLDYDEKAQLYQGIEGPGGMIEPELHIADYKLVEDEIPDEEIRDMKKMEQEAYCAASIIKEALGTPYYDCKSQKWKELKKRDIVILLRGAKNTAELYGQALSKEGIPSFADGGDGYFHTVEVEVLLNLLRVIDNYRQDLPLISVLRSPIFDLTTEELISIRIPERSGPYHKAFTLYGERGGNEELKRKCKGIINRIRRWAKEATFMPLDDFLWMILGETAYADYVAALPGGVQREANIRALVDKAVSFQQNQRSGLFSFIQYIEAIKKEKISMGQVKLLGEKDDVVRIMTIHKSKGLEFPMVLVGGLAKKFRLGTTGSSLCFHKDIGIGLRWVDGSNKSYKKTLLQTIIDEQKIGEDLAEEIRVLYVAFTRAMDKLVLLGSLQDFEKSKSQYDLIEGIPMRGSNYLDYIMPILSRTNLKLFVHNKQEIQINRENEARSLDDVKSILEKTSGQSFDVNLMEEIHGRLEYQYEFSKATLLKSKFSVSELNQLKNYQNQAGNYKREALVMPAFLQGEKLLSPSEVGTAIHTLMEHLDFGLMMQPENRRESYIDEQIKELVKGEILLEAEGQVIDRKKVLAFFDSNIGKRASQAKNLYKESSFNLKKEFSGEEIILQGTIDCYFEEGEGLILLDYKSNYLRKTYEESAIEELVKSYEGQLSLYKEALEKILGKKVLETYLYLFSFDREVKVGE